MEFSISNELAAPFHGKSPIHIREMIVETKRRDIHRFAALGLTSTAFTRPLPGRFLVPRMWAPGRVA
jgi:hypothetical protein